MIDTEVNQDFFAKKDSYIKTYPKIIYTGMIDQFFDYQYGELEYRSLHFESSVLNQVNYQGNPVVNYTDAETPFTRIVEHKHFEFGTQPKTVITKEYPKGRGKGDEPYYPVNDNKNNEIYRNYQKLAEEHPTIISVGDL